MFVWFKRKWMLCCSDEMRIQMHLWHIRLFFTVLLLACCLLIQNLRNKQTMEWERFINYSNKGIWEITCTENMNSFTSVWYIYLYWASLLDTGFIPIFLSRLDLKIQYIEVVWSYLSFYSAAEFVYIRGERDTWFRFRPLIYTSI